MRGKSSLKILVWVALSFFVWFASLSTSGSAYAMGGGGGGRHDSRSSGPGQALNPDGSTDANGVAPVPEPATWLLVGSGLAGLALLRKKFKK